MSNGFPQYISSAKQGELGINIVSKIISDTFGWLFRRIHQEHDFGIDGQIELVTDTGSVTGKMLAVQVKCGKTFIKEQNKWGYIYRGELKHFNYLSNYPIPVIIVICNPASGEAYWVHFQQDQTKITEAGWMLTIPFENKLSMGKAALQALVPPTNDCLEELRIYWEVNQILADASIIHYVIDKHQIDSLSTAEPRAFFDRLRATKELAYECQGKIEISFFGYGDDSRELFEIEPVRKYVALLDLALPELLFFVRTEQPTNTLVTVALCLTKVLRANNHPTRKKTKKVEFETGPLEEFLMRQFSGLNEIADWLGMSVEENKRITFAAIKCLGLPIPK